MTEATTSRATILVVDDHPSNIKAVRAKLAAQQYRILEASNGTDALELFADEEPDLVLLDIMMPGIDGYEVCARMKRLDNGVFTPVILVTAKTEIEALVRGFEAGADDYITKPFMPIELVARVRAMLRIREALTENARLRAELAGNSRFDRIIGESASMKRVKELAAKVVDREVTVLLIGETGTGKEAFARAIHFNGRRSGQRFVAANCGALSESLLESELFGHRRGSFTGATEDRIGLLEAASGGTVFLDEIGETRFTRADSARTSTTASTCSRSGCRRCANDVMTSRSWPGISWTGSPASSGRAARASRAKPWTHSCPAIGRAMFGNWPTKCSERSSWQRRANGSTCRTCRIGCEALPSGRQAGGHAVAC
jgi:DNA-binding response OmpR family regulator